MGKKKQFKSIRPFIGAKDYEESRSFYKDFGFAELVLTENLIYFNKAESLGFYLQKANVKDWIDNTMLFLEVENIEEYLKDILSRNLIEKYPKVKISEIVYQPWGKVFFVHDPSGILWQIGNFNN